MVKLSVLDWVVIILLILGGLHWGVAGLWGLSVLTNLYNQGGPLTFIAIILSDLMGVAAIYMIYLLVKWNRASAK